MDCVIVAGLPCLLGAIYILAETASGLGFALDDPWIHLTFGKNLAEGYGFSFNPGEPVAGSTSPLWSVMLAGPHLISLNLTWIMIAAKFLGVAFLAAASASAYHVARSLSGSRGAALAPGIFFSTFCYQSWGAVSGMEIGLYVFLTMLAVALATREPSIKVDSALAAVLALAVYARPECLVLTPLLLAERIWQKKIRSAGLICLVFAIAIVPYFVFNYSLSGSIVPNTFQAKAGGQGLFAAVKTGSPWLIKRSLFTGLVYSWQFMVHLYRGNPLAPPGFIIGVCVMIWQGFKRRRGPWLFIAMIALSYSAAIGLVSPFRGAGFQAGRYIAGQTGVAVMISVLGYFWALAYVQSRSAGFARLLLYCLLALGLFNQVMAQRSMFRYHVSGVKSINQIQVKTAKWLAANASPGSSVMTPDVGAIGYFSGLKVIDLGGLVTPETLDFYRAHKGEKDLVLQYAALVRPSYLVLFPDFYPELVKKGDVVFSAAKLDNTASQYVFELRSKTFLELVLLELYVDPRPSELVVIEYEAAR